MVKYALKTMPAKRKNILDVYRDFKKKDPDYAYAFGDEQFFTFYMADAHRVHNALPEMRIEHERYDFLKVHKLLFLPLAAKLQMLGVKTAMVARAKTPQGNFTYSISARSDDGALSGDMQARRKDIYVMSGKKITLPISVEINSDGSIVEGADGCGVVYWEKR